MTNDNHASYKIFLFVRVLDESEEMTDLGKLLVELPIDPQFGKMVLIGMTLKCLEPSIVIACCSAYKEPCMYYVLSYTLHNFKLHKNI